MQVVPKASSKGNAMLVVTMDVTDVAGRTLKVDDFLVATPEDEAGMKRLKTKIMNISKAIGKPELYAPGAGKLKPSDLVGYGGYCEIKTQTSDQYSDRTVISKYIDKASMGGNSSVAADDPLPF